MLRAQREEKQGDRESVWVDCPSRLPSELRVNRASRVNE
jgi:hypothetical protein